MVSVVVDDSEFDPDELSSRSDREGRLLTWCLPRVDKAREAREQKFDEKWAEYYRLWRGIHDNQDKTRGSERSKLISPALQSAVESVVSEQEEAIFGRKNWFDIVDDWKDRLEGNDKDLRALQAFLMDKFDSVNVASSMANIFLNGALYGTGIGKIVTETKVEKVFKPFVQGVPLEQIMQQLQQAAQMEGWDQQTLQAAVQRVQQQVQWRAVDEEKFYVRLDPVDNFNFGIDPVARSIEEAEYVFHESYKPEHSIIEKQKEGVYRDADVGTIRVKDHKTETLDSGGGNDMGVKVVEFYGKIPESLLDVDLESDEELVDLEPRQSNPDQSDGNETVGIELGEDENLVEAIVTIANDHHVLRAIHNPFWNEDRPFVAYQHDTVPNSFWGRGVCEKGYNAQKALDAELRARMDGLALTVHPMMAFDVTKMPRGSNFTVHPGRSIPVNGPPNDALKPFNFGQIDPAVFQNTGDLERMVQVATGTGDPVSPSPSPRNSTASGMSMALSSAVKRSKRTLANIERNLVKAWLKKSSWRYMQFDPESVPARDLQFITHSTLGITARELEQQNLVQLLQTVNPESPVFNLIVKSIVDNSSISNREELVTAIEQMMEPDPQQQQLQAAQQQIAIAKEQAEVEERKSRTAENYADIQKIAADIKKMAEEAEFNQDKLDVDVMNNILDLRAAMANKAGQGSSDDG